jgi:hypothetical protein
MSELPRPMHSGSWECEETETEDGDTVISGRLAGKTYYVAVAKPWDAPAIAALPDWIAAHDEWKARAEKAEAALGEYRGTLGGSAVYWRERAEQLEGDYDRECARSDEAETRAEKAEAALAEVYRFAGDLLTSKSLEDKKLGGELIHLLLRHGYGDTE